MNKKIKIAMVTNHFGITGISTVILNYCKELDHHKYDLTIIAGQPIAEENRKECAENDIHLIEVPSRHQRPMKHYLGLWKAFRKDQYDIIHVHGSSSMMAIELTIAKWAGIKIRIAHSHNSRCPNKKIHKLLNPYFKMIYTKALACGKMAGDWLFGEGEFEVLPNGFHTKQFDFSQRNRDTIRRQLKIEDQYVLGHIGRVNAQKNQEYLLKVFGEIADKCDKAILLLIGTGPDEEKIKREIEEHPYKDRIIMYGETDNPAVFYSAMDIFVFPSKYEGLPVVLLEAQISGLPCVVSDKVTQEVNFGEIKWQSIESDPMQWADEILKLKQRTDKERSAYTEKHLQQIKQYDIEQNVKEMEKIYMELIGKRSI